MVPRKKPPLERWRSLWRSCRRCSPAQLTNSRSELARGETETLETKVGVAADEIANDKSGFNTVDDPHRVGSHRPYRFQHDRRQLREVDAAVRLPSRRVPSPWGV